MLGVFFEWRGKRGNRSGGEEEGGAVVGLKCLLSLSPSLPLTVLEWSFYSSSLKARYSYLFPGKLFLLVHPLF